MATMTMPPVAMPEVVNAAIPGTGDSRNDARRSAGSGSSQVADVATVKAQPEQTTVANQASATPAISIRKRATGGKLSGKFSGKTSGRKATVEAVKQSKGTWAFRLRWNALPGRPVEYVSRVTDDVYNAIRADKETYESFKKQILSQRGARTI